MTRKMFLNGLANAQADVVQELLDLLHDLNIDYCVIGGLAVNAYVEPVVSLDLDLVITVKATSQLIKAAEQKFAVKHFPHSINFKSADSELRIQIQTDPRYQAFISRAASRTVMGYDMKVAAVEDVLQGKIWAWSDQDRRRSKRQKDLADIFRLLEAYPDLVTLLPEPLKAIYQT